MRYCPRTLRDFVQSFSPFSPAKEALEEFGQSLESYLAGIADSKSESEEHQKNLLRDFLNQAFGYDCNTRGKIDLAIYDDSVPKVLFEVKKSNNSHEFVKPNAQNLESKAFYESILYFLRETLANNNNNLTHIVLTNTEDFYIIDAKVYATFAKDKAIIKAFKNCDYKEGNHTSTERFYAELGNLLPHLDMEIQYTHFRIEDSILANIANCHSEASAEESQHIDNKESHNILPLLYQALSPQVLLKRKTYLDANTLNQDFYNELLYILGLKENAQNGKVLILPSQTQNTLLDSICSTFGLERDKDFEILFSLLTTWNNRLLFLRLLESMLLSFKHIQKPFLDLECLKDFQALNTLFFDILAKIEENRDINLPKALAQIPYLNSSLFEKTKLEIEGKEIKLLESKPLTLYHDSILYKDKNFCQSLNLNAQAKDSTLPLLEYLFAFLHAYDFTTTAKDIQNHTKMNFDKLINSAVLGLVFEKLNGYKEGSFYTPSFITRYMCKQSLERVVLQKFNESLQWDCQNLEELKIKIDKLTDNKEGYKSANAIFDSIHICDPAVGSGHFLVSALNELILLKFKLGILCDENHNRIKDITLEILRDEIVIRDSSNTLFTYTLPAHDNIESHKIQRALFFAKRKLIESCLFGVDINPNSCEITKLRLWIELLKYSYYKDIPNKRLETLPNIDINIKCGNSLISNIALDITKDSLIKELKRTASKNASLEFSAEFQATANDLQNKLPKKIEEYREAVNDYKNETNADFKALQKKTIAECRDFITQLFFKLSNEYKIFKEALANYLRNYGYYGIDEGKIKGQYIEQTLQQKLNDYLIAFNFHKTLEIPKNITEYNEKELVFLITSLQNYERLIHNQNAFEWRFAFPEVLDSNGDFLGFDLVIGNPPYGVELTKSQREQYKSIYKISNTDTAALFILKSDSLLAKNGINSLIVPKALTFASNWNQVRDFIKPTFFLLTDCGKAWSYVLLEMVIFARQKGVQYATYHTRFLQDDTHTESKEIIQDSVMEIDKKFIDLFDFIPNNLSQEELDIGVKIRENHHFTLADCGENIWGDVFYKDITESQNDFLVLGGKEIQRYSIRGVKGYISKTIKMSDKANIKINSILMQRIIAHIENPTPHIKMTGHILETDIDKFKIVNTIHQIVCKDNLSNRYILGLLHSTFLNWYCYRFTFAKAIRSFQFSNEMAKRIPIPKITKSNQKIVDRIIALVDEILNLKAKDSTTDTTHLESEIDKLVYELYNVSNEEINIIENKEQK